MAAGQGPYVTKTGELAGRLPTPAIQWREYGSRTGYSGISMRYAANGVALIEAIAFTYGPGESEFQGRSLSPGFPGQAYGGIGDGATKTVTCPAGHTITEMFGETNMSNILTIGLKCRKSSGAAAAVRPEPQPGSDLANIQVPAPSLVGTPPPCWQETQNCVVPTVSHCQCVLHPPLCSTRRCMMSCSYVLSQRPGGLRCRLMLYVVVRC